MIDQIFIAINVNSIFGHFVKESTPNAIEFRQKIQHLVNDLLKQLDIPTQCNISFSSTPLPLIYSFQIKINNMSCRAPIPCIVDKFVSLQGLVSSIGYIIYINRKLLLTEKLIAQIWEKWQKEPILAQKPLATTVKIISKKAAQEQKPKYIRYLSLYIITLLSYGLKISYIKQLIPFLAQEVNESLLDNVFYEKVLTLDKLSLAVLFNENHIQLLKHNSAELHFQPDEETGSDISQYLISLLSSMIFLNLGLLLPSIKLMPANDLKDNEFQFQLNDLKFPPMEGFGYDRLLVSENGAWLSVYNIEGKSYRLFLDSTEYSLIPISTHTLTATNQLGVNTRNNFEFILSKFAVFITLNAQYLLTYDHVTFILQQLKQGFPGFINILSKQYSTQQIWMVLRELLSEQISIRDVKTIFTNLSIVQVKCKKENSTNPESLSQCIVELRKAIKKQITSKYLIKNQIHLVYLLDTVFDYAFTMNINFSSSSHDLFLNEVHDTVGMLNDYENPVILTTEGARRQLRSFLEVEFPNLGVISYEEVDSHSTIIPLGRIVYKRSKYLQNN